VRAVIDTNVLISAIFWTGRPKQLLNKVRRGEIIFLTSLPLLEELKAVLMREDKPFRLSVEEADRVVATMWALAEIVQTQSRVAVCRDEADNSVGVAASITYAQNLTVNTP
jgi:putative PIN family toxin of toxin-antitoxin system